MPEPSFALRKAIHATLSADAALVALLPPSSIFDEVPRGREPPYVVLGEGSVGDWSTSSDRGHEHQLALAIWSKEGGVRQVFAIADAAVSALERMPALLEGHRLVNLVALATEVRRETERRHVKGIVRLRAVTEAGGG
jgi:Protein of unknown function (DUF3168)